MAPRPDPSALDRAAAPVLGLIDDFNRQIKAGEHAILGSAQSALAAFERDAARGGAPATTIKPARYALAVLLDLRARQATGVSLGTWSVLAQRQLFEGRDVSLARIRDFRDTAARQGADYADLERFLSRLIAQAEVGRDAHRTVTSGNWGLRIGGYVVVLALVLIGYTGWLEYRFHQRLSAVFAQEALSIGLDRPQSGTGLVQRLDDMQAAVEHVAQAASRAPLRRVIRLPFGDGETQARATYAAAVRRHVPPVIAAGIEEVLASEGDGLILYDALRAWSVLTGEEDWSPAYLTGWLEDNGKRVGLAGLGAHLGPLDGPATDITPNDSTVMDQARAFAAEVPEPARAWLELLRAERMRALPAWHPVAQVPGIGDVLLRRSGLPIDTPLPGLFTAHGWDEARDFAVGGAVQQARALAQRITGQVLPTQNRSPDLLMDRLHLETIAFWKDWLADLRVRPFAQRETAIVVSGALAQAENPLTRLLRQVWAQAGGADRARSHPQQLVLAREFGAMIQYVEQGRMREIARLFSTLNVALGAIDISQSRGSQRLMSVQDRARSITALKNAPRIVVQIAEDVLAQSAQPESQGNASNPLTRGWQQEVFPLCRDVTSAHYPFANGPDVAVGDLTALLGPQGVLTTYTRQSAAPFLDTETSPWRWKPEARFAGLVPESAAFLERAAQVSQGLFGPDGTLRHDLTLAALAERGQTMFAIGGVAEPVRATGAPAALSWPGPQPQAGVEVSFRDSADSARLLHSGPWGLLRLMDGLRLRLRDDGARVLLDLRTESGRVFLEMGFAEPLNPVSVRPALQGFACPPAL
ncbi:ImcF-related family protein [Puniceibacterium sp. IMCC21224]|uniref:ImcF-related family protein n=1 Tax=Puniceibacterium sp. IMCC21224 TaxID=1618204 RepID=UPI00064DC733|nr:ImcF-related family protein [Puniceibacterium sp. IMCC21224]KMK65224.1 hypothetical protein IMCC21224_1154 [Puniceibacterium sp. IMCC21224]